jgi:protein phosphatase methylesterase 1
VLTAWCGWRCVQQVFRVYFSGPDEGPLFVLLHGGGHSALSWAATVGALQQTARVLAFDFRGHGIRSFKSSRLLARTHTAHTAHTA